MLPFNRRLFHQQTSPLSFNFVCHFPHTNANEKKNLAEFILLFFLATFSPLKCTRFSNTTRCAQRDICLIYWTIELSELGELKYQSPLSLMILPCDIARLDSTVCLCCAFCRRTRGGGCLVRTHRASCAHVENQKMHFEWNAKRLLIFPPTPKTSDAPCAVIIQKCFSNFSGTFKIWIFSFERF